MLRLPRALLKNSPFYYLLPLRGREPHFRFGVPANHLASLSFPFRCPATWGHLSANIWSPVWPTFLPNGHFLTAWYSHSIREDSISPTSSSPWAITWQQYVSQLMNFSVYLHMVYICLCFLHDRTWYEIKWPKGRTVVRVKRGEGWARAEARALLVYADHRFI